MRTLSAPDGVLLSLTQAPIAINANYYKSTIPVSALLYACIPGIGPALPRFALKVLTTRYQYSIFNILYIYTNIQQHAVKARSAEGALSTAADGSM